MSLSKWCILCRSSYNGKSRRLGAVKPSEVQQGKECTHCIATQFIHLGYYKIFEKRRISVYGVVYNLLYISRIVCVSKTRFEK